jgi:hypothetical protein
MGLLYLELNRLEHIYYILIIPVLKLPTVQLRKYQISYWMPLDLDETDIK